MDDALPLAVALPEGGALQGRHWPRAGAPALVLLVHGLGEHQGRHDGVVARLRRAGLAVASYDQRGHGASPGPRGDMPDGEAPLRDLAAVIDALRAGSTEARPLLLLGHSLGGLVAARFVGAATQAPAPAWSRPVDGLLLSSPALDPGLTAPQRALLAAMHRLAPHAAVGNGLKADWISRDPAVVAAYRADPQVHDRITATLARFIVDAAQAVQAQAPHWRTPTLLLWAGADRCVAACGSARFAAAAPRGVVAAHEFPGLYHELFNEPEREQVFAVLEGWLAGAAPAWQAGAITAKSRNTQVG